MPPSSTSEPIHFFVGGAQRSGTTRLRHLLAAHPLVAMAQPLRPEPKYFLRAAPERFGLEDYRRTCFAEAGGRRLWGEKSTSYLEEARVAERVRELLPDARWVFVLRDPVERAISNYWFSVERGAETASMEEAFRHEAERIERYDHSRFSVSPFAYLRRGRYLDFLEPYARCFPRQNLRLILFEDFVRDEAGALTRILGDFGVPAAPGPVLPEGQRNASPRNAPVSETLRRYLHEQFVDSNRALAERFDLDLSAWRRTVNRND